MTKGNIPMNNRLTDLNDHLFNQLKRLSDDGLSDEKVTQEVSRTKAIVDVADKIIGAASLSLSAVKVLAAHGDQYAKHMPMISGPVTVPDPVTGPYDKQDYAGVKSQ